MLRASLTSLAASASVLLLLGPGCTGDDDYVPNIDEPPTFDATATQEPDASDLDGGAPDNTSPDPAVLERCASCVTDDCGPALLECLQDDACRELGLCAISTGCIQNPITCLTECVEEGTDPTSLFGVLVSLQAIASSCGECFETCGELVDGGLELPGLPFSREPGAAEAR